jgi:hypothetical protein
MAITLITAIQETTTPSDIISTFKAHDITLTHDRLEELLAFLKNFGVVQEYEMNKFRITSGYLLKAIQLKEPEEDLRFELDKGKKVEED